MKQFRLPAIVLGLLIAVAAHADPRVLHYNLGRALHATSLIAASGDSSNSARTKWSSLYYADSLAGGDSTKTLAIPCFGASSMIFYYGHRDTVGACAGTDSCRGYYSDSASAALQFSNDGVNWSTGRTAGVQPTLGITITDGSSGAVTPWNDRVQSMHPGASGAGGARTMIVNPSTTNIASYTFLIPQRYVRFNISNPSRPRRATGSAELASMYKPFVRCEVAYLFGLPNPSPAIPFNP